MNQITCDFHIRDRIKSLNKLGALVYQVFLRLENTTIFAITSHVSSEFSVIGLLRGCVDRSCVDIGCEGVLIDSVDRGVRMC